MVSLPLCHIDGKRQEKEWYVPNPTIYIRTLVHIFIPFGLHSSRTLNPGRPMMIWSAIKLPDGLRSFTELRICGTSSVCCGDTFRTPSASGLTSCPSFSFSATSGVGGSSSNCIFRSSAASSDFNCFSSSSFFHTFPAISYNCGTSFSCTSFFALYWSMMDGILSYAFRKLRAAATGSAIASMQPMSYKDTDTTGEPVEHVTEPDKQIAHSALGDYGPFSVKYATKEFLSYGNKKFRI